MSSEKITRHSASATMRMMPGGVLLVAMAGPVTVEALHVFRAEVIRRHGETVQAFVVDYRRAMIAVDGPELDAILADLPDDSPAARPAAMVVRTEHLGLFIGHASRMALRGVFRRVEVAPEAAMAWALEQLRQRRQIQRP